MVTIDKIKFFCLMALTLVCIRSLFTSQSISMMNPSMRVITAMDANKQKFCAELRKVATGCEARDSNEKFSETQENCKKHREVANKCVRVVQNAFRYINMGGCPKQIKLLTLCEDEWCHQQDPTSCRKECAGVRKNLSICVEETMEFYFKTNGLKKIGTIG